MIHLNSTRFFLTCNSFLMVSLITACAPVPSPPDPTQLALVAHSTLQVVGTQLAVKETLTATALWPTNTHTPTRTSTPTETLTPTPTPTETPTPLPNGIVKEAGPLRAGPGKVFPVVKQLLGGEVLTPLGQTAAGGWFSVIVEDGMLGWLPASNFDFVGDLSAIPVLTDLPPTPTLPPPTFTPLPTPTSTPFPYACEVYITNAVAPGQIVFIGTNWPPNTLVSIAEVGNFEYTIATAQSDASGAFQTVTSDRPGSTRKFRVFIEGCSRQLQFP